ncbi:signal transduction histidine kinase [Aequitasia blattaphilus]|uniref:histidine kinase n=1 Tax=Aequitasia blattaphilus TaxID=2949332 RepID=A0ABT1E5L5_9FIRM|nr:HAMP domain-containing sensor histidine kinase [Aequitasia blattaphilus]MCP1101043.1 HAMP domain-containing histidine kinase [Aequitasia blattaphilus]MCR8613683.1 HAMP domain-containing histidine kinase [Aequitasia blattaphilus]
MKLKTRLILSFFFMVAIPLTIILGVIQVIGRVQINTIKDNYDISGTTIGSLSNFIQITSMMTEEHYMELLHISMEDPKKLEDDKYLDEFNKHLEQEDSYLIIRKSEDIIYQGSNGENVDEVIAHLPPHAEIHGEEAGNDGLYVGTAEALVKQIDFTYPNQEKGTAFIVSDAGNVIPDIGRFFRNVALGVMVVLVLMSGILIYWIYRGIINPIGKMQKATKNIKAGNLDFELSPVADDEIGQLCKDLEDMRKRLKDNAEEKLIYDRESKELISNISHDLKTPVTAIKGYAEGIMDGVADTPEKMDKYIRTIYNKANEMNLLINELTLYSKIDTNRIPYNFATLSTHGYFGDSSEDLSLELESKGVVFEYRNDADPNTMIIADAEQIRRVVHNIVNNSIKYMDKDEPVIKMRVKDIGDFVQVELEDNGKGIAAKDLAHIFERFYRTDASRNSSKGGSGIGLSIVKKIIEEHGGKIWATSKEGIGTTVYFVLRKFQEVPIGE